MRKTDLKSSSGRGYLSTDMEPFFVPSTEHCVPSTSDEKVKRGEVSSLPSRILSL